MICYSLRLFVRSSGSVGAAALRVVRKENLKLRVTWSIWHQVLRNCKTDASAKPVPMDSYMARDLLRWRRQRVYASDDHYVLASETMKGKQPYWLDNLMKRHIQPVAKARHSQENRMGL